MYARETIRKHAKILTDFANAEKTDEACLTYFKNIQDFLLFSPKFIARINKVFPYLNSFHESFNETEHKVLGLIEEEQFLLEDLDNQFQKYGYFLKGCDPKNKALILAEMDVEMSAPDEWDIGELESVSIPLDELNDNFGGFLDPDMFDDIYEYMEVTDRLNKFKCKISEKRLKVKELSDLSEKHAEIHFLHNKINRVQNDYQTVIKMVVEGKALNDIQQLETFIKLYYNMPTIKLKTDGDYLEQVPPISEANYFRINSFNGWWNTLQNEFALLVVEFFMVENNRHYLRECQQCERFYVSKTLAASKYCSDKCRMAFHNRKRIKSGVAKEYKRKKRLEGAKESYYG